MSFLDGGGTDGQGNYSDVPVNSTYGQSPPVVITTDYSDNFSPGNASAGATSWLDVLKYGFGRVIDYKTASLSQANVQPQYAQQQQAQTPLLSVPSRINTGTLLLIGAGVLGFFLLTSSGKKG